MLYLVRHAMPAATESTQAAEWELTSEGQAAASRLVSMLPPDAAYVASAERKAQQTLPERACRIDPRLNEVDRGDEAWSEDFREQRRAWVAGTAHAGWEAHETAAHRFGAAVAEAATKDRPDVVVASHGLAITNWLASTGAIGRTDAAAFWDSLGFPDCWLLDDGRLVGRLDIADVRLRRTPRGACR